MAQFVQNCFYQHGLIFYPAWISNYMANKLQDEIIYHRWSFGMRKKFNFTFKMDVITDPCWDKHLSMLAIPVKFCILYVKNKRFSTNAIHGSCFIRENLHEIKLYYCQKKCWHCEKVSLVCITYQGSKTCTKISEPSHWEILELWKSVPCIFLVSLSKYYAVVIDNYNDVIMSAMASQITSPTIVFNQPFIRAQTKENIKAPRDWPLCGEFTGGRWIPRTKGQ